MMPPERLIKLAVGDVVEVPASIGPVDSDMMYWRVLKNEVQNNGITNLKFEVTYHDVFFMTVRARIYGRRIEWSHGT